MPSLFSAESVEKGRSWLVLGAGPRISLLVQGLGHGWGEYIRVSACVCLFHSNCYELPVYGHDCVFVPVMSSLVNQTIFFRIAHTLPLSVGNPERYGLVHETKL